MDQVNLWKTAFKKFEEVWSAKAGIEKFDCTKERTVSFQQRLGYRTFEILKI